MSEELQIVRGLGGGNGASPGGTQGWQGKQGGERGGGRMWRLPKIGENQC